MEKGKTKFKPHASNPCPRVWSVLAINLSLNLRAATSQCTATTHSVQQRYFLDHMSMGGTTTRARTKAKAQPVADATAEDDDAAAAMATQLADLSARVHQLSISAALSNQKREATDAEHQALREDIAMLRSKAAAAEERAYHTAATVKELQYKLLEEQKNVQDLEEKLADTRSRLRDVEDGHRKIEDSMRSKTRDTIEEIKNHVVKQQKDLERSALNVGRVVAMRAESMVSDMDDARSQVSSSVAASSVPPRYAHSSVESARRGLRAA